MQLIDVTEYLMGRITLQDLTPDMLANLNTIVPRANDLLTAFGEYRTVNSGYRSPAYQMQINPNAPHSKHEVCAAVDLEDKDNRLKDWCMANLGTLADIGLWMEDPKSTPDWVHVQCIPPGSGHRVFIP